MKKDYIKPNICDITAKLGGNLLETIGGQSHNPVSPGKDESGDQDVEFSAKEYTLPNNKSLWDDDDEE